MNALVVLAIAVASIIIAITSIIAVLVHKRHKALQVDVPAQPQVEEISPPNLDVFNCRINLKSEQKDNVVTDWFNLDICGTIHCIENMTSVSLEIKALDVTDDSQLPVQSNIKKHQSADGAFFYKASLGKLPDKVTVLKDWLSVAKIQTNWLLLPLKGSRKVKFTVSIHSAADSAELAASSVIISYSSLLDGYIDLNNKLERTKTLAVAVAFAVSTVDKKMYASEIAVIKNWAKANICNDNASQDSVLKLDNALEHTLAFFKAGHSIDCVKICQEIMQLSNPSHRYDILELCILVAQAKGVIVAEELTFLRQISRLLDVDFNRCRQMMEKSISTELMQAENTEVLLGVTADMPPEEARHRLNQEYRKWNARVTNTDPQIRSQADNMLNFIAEARKNFVK